MMYHIDRTTEVTEIFKLLGFNCWVLQLFQITGVSQKPQKGLSLLLEFA